MTGTIRTLEGCRVLELQGCVMGTDMAAAMSVVRQLLDDTDHVVLELGRVSYADTALFQTVCCLHQTARRAGKALSISGSIPEPLNRMVRIAGLAEDGSCRYCGDGACAWREGIGLLRQMPSL